MHKANAKSTEISTAIMALVAIQERQAVAMESLCERLSARTPQGAELLAAVRDPELSMKALFAMYVSDGSATSPADLVRLTGLSNHMVYTNEWVRGHFNLKPIKK